jgi:hypothetical protein
MYSRALPMGRPTGGGRWLSCERGFWAHMTVHSAGPYSLWNANLAPEGGLLCSFSPPVRMSRSGACMQTCAQSQCHGSGSLSMGTQQLWPSALKKRPRNNGILESSHGKTGIKANATAGHTSAGSALRSCRKSSANGVGSRAVVIACSAIQAASPSPVNRSSCASFESQQAAPTKSTTTGTPQVAGAHGVLQTTHCLFSTNA